MSTDRTDAPLSDAARVYADAHVAAGGTQGRDGEGGSMKKYRKKPVVVGVGRDSLPL